MTSLAILGLDMEFGAGHTLEDYARAIYAGRRVAASTLPPADPANRLARVAGGALSRAGRFQTQRLAVLICADPVEPWANQAVAELRQVWTIPAPTLATSTLRQALATAHNLLVEQEADLALLLSPGPHSVEAIALARADEVPPEDAYARLESEETAFSLAELNYLETFGPFGPSDLVAYRLPDTHLTCALSSEAPSPLAALIKVALCLHRRTLPPWPGWEGPSHPEHWQNTPFYVAPEARPWFAPRRAGLRLSDDLGQFHCVLTEPGPTRLGAPVCSQPGDTTLHLVLLTAPGQAALLNKLAALQRQIKAGQPIDTLAQAAFAAHQREPSRPFVLALASHDLAELEREVIFALEGIPKAFETGQPWTSPRGSYFTARPLGAAGLTFVYPGAFNAYVGLGRDLFQYFPWLHEKLAAAVADVGQSLAEQLLYPRHLAPLSGTTASAPIENLAADPAAMIEAGTLFSIALTALLRDIFGVQPQFAFGYSLGEVSMLWAGEVWADTASGSAAWRQSPLFKTRLFGPKEAVREAWGQASPSLAAGGDEFWQTYLLKAPVEKVRAALASETRVYLTMINLPDEVVIAGEPAGCLRVIRALKGHVIRVPFDSVLHNPAMKSEHAALAELYSHPIQGGGEVTYFSAGHYEPVPLERAPLADTLADMTCQPLDFPRLVNTVYAGGARLFVEVGPQGTCTRWIERILRGRDFAALPLNRPRAGDYDSVVSVLAMLVSQGVPVNLAPFYALAEAEVEPLGQDQPHPLSPADHLGRQAALHVEGHQAFLQARQAALRQTAELMQMQANLSEQMLALAGHQPASPLAPRPKPVIDQAALRAFASGDPEACFGPAYAVYRGRRVPRLPNGDLLLVDRVLSIDSPIGRVKVGASLISEYDVPADAWFLRQRSSLPHVALMELALQPCGVLAAYLGSTLPYPELDFYFRNLDGQGELLSDIDVRQRTIVNRVQLLSASALQGIILQNYAFELACDGVPFFRGTSSFGYFTREALNSQAGLGEAEVAPTPRPGSEWASAAVPPAGHSQLDFIEQAWVSPQGGRHSLGRVYAETPVRSQDWFFKCHFFQDPVMPGSLGVEAVRQAVQILGSRLSVGGAAVAQPLPGRPMTWKYRGQMTPEDGRLRLDAHVTHVAASADGLALLADASVWKDACRIYEIKNLGVTLPGAPANER